LRFLVTERVLFSHGKPLNTLFQKYKNEKWVLTKDELLKKKNSWFTNKWSNLNWGPHSEQLIGLDCGLILKDGYSLEFVSEKKSRIIILSHLLEVSPNKIRKT